MVSEVVSRAAASVDTQAVPRSLDLASLEIDNIRDFVRVRCFGEKGLNPAVAEQIDTELGQVLAAREWTFNDPDVARLLQSFAYEKEYTPLGSTWPAAGEQLDGIDPRTTGGFLGGFDFDRNESLVNILLRLDGLPQLSELAKFALAERCRLGADEYIGFCGAFAEFDDVKAANELSADRTLSARDRLNVRARVAIAKTQRSVLLRRIAGYRVVKGVDLEVVLRNTQAEWSAFQANESALIALDKELQTGAAVPDCREYAYGPIGLGLHAMRRTQRPWRIAHKPSPARLRCYCPCASE